LGTLKLENIRRLAVVGVAKNCGKTTTLNAISAWAGERGRTVGLASVGIDGETADVLLGTSKPPVWIKPEQWVVSAADALHSSTAQLEYVQDLGIETPLGKIVLARALSEGEVILAGLRHKGDLVAAADAMESHGVNLVMIDGAYGRVVAAHSDITDGVILSTGAVISPIAQRVAEKTSALIQRLSFPKIDAGWQVALMEEAIAEERTLFGGENVGSTQLPARSALVGLPKARKMWRRELTAIAIPGLVSDRVGEELVRYGGHGRTLLVPDGTVVQCDAKILRRLEKSFEIRALAVSRVLAISLNPTSVQGHVLSEVVISQLLSQQWPNIPMFNPRVGLESNNPLIRTLGDEIGRD
jgi:hypothetical protein